MQQLGHELSPEDQFCSNCGTPVHRAARVPTPDADVPIPPPPQQAGGTAPPSQQSGASQEGWRQRHPILTGCLAVIGLLFLLVFVAATFGGLGDQQASSPPERVEKDEGVEGGGAETEAKKPLEGEKAKPEKQREQLQQERQRQPQQQGGGEQEPEQQKHSFSDGVYQVGTDIQPGNLSNQGGGFARVLLRPTWRL